MSNELWHASRVKSKYSGGFYKVGSKAMNTPAYNRDYYEKNKEKWVINRQKRAGKSEDKGRILTEEQAKKKANDKTIHLSNGMEIPDWIVRMYTFPVSNIIDFVNDHKSNKKNGPNDSNWEIDDYGKTRHKKQKKAKEPKEVIDENANLSFFKISDFLFGKKSLKHAAVMQTSSGGSKSKYAGGFEMKNNRLNNTKAYNHDYYMKNKEKWSKDGKGNKDSEKKGQNYGSLFFIPTSWFNTALELSVAALYTGFLVVDRLLNQPSNKTSEPRIPKSEVKDKLSKTVNDHKYVYKVTRPDGSVRYFYSEAEYNAYLSNLQRKESPCTVEEDMKAVNPKYFTDKRNNDENCAYCTLAYDLRRRGYDVTAISENDKAFEDVYADTIRGWYKGGDKAYTHHRAEVKNNAVDSTEETSKLYKELSSQGTGASGFVMCTWKTGGAHAMAYQVIDGEAVIIDTQRQVVYDERTFAKEVAKNCVWAYSGPQDDYWDDYLVSYMRTDNLEPSKNVASKVKNVDGSSKHSYRDDPGKFDKVELEQKTTARKDSP